MILLTTIIIKTIYDFTKAYNNLIGKGVSPKDTVFIQNLYYLLDDFERIINITGRNKNKDTGSIDSPKVFTCDISNAIYPMPPSILFNEDQDEIPVAIQSLLPDTKKDTTKELVYFVPRGLAYDTTYHKPWNELTDCVMILDPIFYKIYLKNPLTHKIISCVQDLNLINGSDLIRGYRQINTSAIPINIILNSDCK
jgi:hypothetical protein